MKTIAIILIGIIVILGFIFVVYDFNTNELIKTKFNSAMGYPCELKHLPNGFTRIENCAEYKIIWGK